MELDREWSNKWIVEKIKMSKGTEEHTGVEKDAYLRWLTTLNLARLTLIFNDVELIVLTVWIMKRLLFGIEELNIRTINYVKKWFQSVTVCSKTKYKNVSSKIETRSGNLRVSHSLGAHVRSRRRNRFSRIANTIDLWAFSLRLTILALTLLSMTIQSQINNDWIEF